MDHEFVLIAGAGLAIMIAASVFARRTGVAAPLLLVALGIGASYLPSTPAIHIEPDIILAGVLPPLLYTSAVKLPVIDVRRNFGLISWLSVVMVIVSALVIGALVHAVFPSISFALAVALGAVVSPTDAVAATAIGHRVGLPPRLMTVLEGESLVNDASALVVLRTALAALAVTTHFSLGHTVLDFVWAVVGAILIGGVVGYLTVLLRQRLDDPVLNTTISFAVPFLAYFPAEEAHACGVLAVVIAGLLTGALGNRRFSARDRQTQSTTWTTISFILESGVFLAMGYELPELVNDARTETSFGELAGLVLLVVGLLIGLRFLGLAWPALQSHFGPADRLEQVQAQLDEFEERLEAMEPSSQREENRVAWARKRLARSRADADFEEREPITGRGLLVLAWAGMRGVVTVAAAQTIPAGTPHRATVVLAAFVVALFTLVAFGISLPAVIAKMNFAAETAEDRRDSVQELMRQIGSAAIDALGPLEDQTIDGEPLDPEVVHSLKDRIVPRLISGSQQLRPAKPDTRDQMATIQRRYLEAMREALNTERSVGAYSSDTYRQVQSFLDTLEQRFMTA
ncbi:sodium:proton antiporter [Kribbella jejuensis]|uniref:cation:proton antiporter n=1 Tax=Kribbella jejuensis TaxID=236068 RepID=UPI0011537128|nr:sodium:proton antiporter [Kribbella jejuensis]